jgi:glutamine amidotransferase
MSLKIIIIDYGMGNLNSVKRKFSRIGVNAEITANPADILNAGKIVLPGVGHFQKAVQNLKELKLWEALNVAVLKKKTPILGICLGMQLMAKYSEEGNIAGLGWFDAAVVKFQIKDKLKYKVPHMGWNQIIKSKESSLMRNVPDLSEFYFVHSYYFKCNQPEDILNDTEYESVFTSAIEKDNIFGVQYHPEKSHDVGEQFLRNFANM